jgi:large subunit ribosomal protein L15
MKLHELKPADGAKKKRKRVGRGTGSGYGKTAGRGTKGQNARSGGGVRPGFEGGQNPLWKRVPSPRGTGFRDPWRVEFTPVNVKRLVLAGFEEGDEVTPQALADAGVIDSPREWVAILGRGEIDIPLIVKAHRFSKSAQAKIEEAGGTVEKLPWHRGGYRTR